jgi:diguanylate cyclase (GGDEF)-like protein
VIDRQPRKLSEQQKRALLTLARHVECMFRLKRSVAELSANVKLRRESEQLLAASETVARATLDALSAQIAILDEKGTILAVNRAWRPFAIENHGDLGKWQEGANYLAVCDAAAQVDEKAGTVSAGIRGVVNGTRNVFAFEYPCHSPTEKRWFVLRVTRFAGDGPVRAVAAHENITERKLAENRSRYEAFHDALTGLPNRLLFADRVARCLEWAKRDRNSFYAVMFLDLDRFKIINDSLGHAAGDILLKTVSRRLRACLRSSDTVAANENLVARMGGDEFTILLDRVKHPLDPQIVAERIMSSLSQPIDFEGHDLRPSVSIGIVVGGGEHVYTHTRELLRDADTAMYRAKAEGKGRYCMFDQSMHEAAMARLRLETDLRLAVERREFVLLYQPILSLESGRIEGVEALIRWSSRGETIGPAEFIRAAEDSGAIIEIGRWVIAEAIHQLAAWRAANPSMSDLTMSVNLSGKQLADELLPACVCDSLAKHEIAPGDFRLELTESIFVDGGDAGREMLENLKLLGVGISMDDFGTGYSSLSYLHRFPVDRLKIDRSFIKNMTAQRDVEAVVQAVISLAHNLGMAVVAEGLETAGQVDYLRSLGCDYGQGFYFSKPLAADECVECISRLNVPIAA